MFEGGELTQKQTRRRRKKQETASYYWVTTRLLRESGPWYSPPITGPDAVVSLVNEHLNLENADREHFVVLYLNSGNQVTAAQVVSIGSLSSTVVHPREVFKTAILTSSMSVIAIHNHPSGDPEPSSEDIAVTKQLVEAGKILGIKVLDHIVIGNKRFWSMRGMKQI
ncbi:DNA repair protein RadC [Syntrophothermus lipocalidus DSM 12680]|uniref:DNA repair protein RadC n=1 Tax=Syntrophothermus lipocalidus (strain DSM 12680 / TGB-C1) TaxID=643648 RepID=D7CPX9_SYNLT|nr:DNA repair protein RadC [Syntrophothermus lipocalidus DSM 12680]